MRDLRIELYELLFKMEKEFNLFNIRTNDGFPLWDIIRFPVFRSIYFSQYNINQTDKNKLTISDVLKKLLFFAKSISSFSNLLSCKSFFFYVGISRFQNKEGEFYDPFYCSVKHLIPDNTIFYETVGYKSKYTKENRVFDILPYLKRIEKILVFLGLRKKRNDSNEIKNIISAIQQTFGNAKIMQIEIEAILNEFRVEFSYYNWLLKIKKIKKILINNGGSKAIFRAANVNQIMIFEFQHGEIVDGSIYYNYCHPEFNINDNIIFPNVLLTFSNIWTKDKFIPAKCIEVGSTLFNHSKIEGKENKSITIISSNDQNSYLEELAMKLAIGDNKNKIYYKLHPQQFARLQEQKNYFRDWSNIEVVSLEKNMTDMLSISDEFIAIYSTAIYEILQAGKVVYIYKRLNYKYFKSNFNLPNVHLFDEAEELPELRKIAVSLKKEAPQFFKPFNEKAFLNAIDS